MKSIVLILGLALGVGYFALGEDLIPWIETKRGDIHDALMTYDVKLTKIDQMIENGQKEINRLKKLQAEAEAEQRVIHKEVEDLAVLTQNTVAKTPKFMQWLQEDPRCPNNATTCTPGERAMVRQKLEHAAKQHMQRIEVIKTRANTLQQRSDVYAKMAAQAKEKREKGMLALSDLRSKRELVAAKMESLKVHQELVAKGQLADGSDVFDDAMNFLDEVDAEIEKSTIKAEVLGEMEAVEDVSLTNTYELDDNGNNVDLIEQMKGYM